MSWRISGPYAPIFYTGFNNYSITKNGQEYCKVTFCVMHGKEEATAEAEAAVKRANYILDALRLKESTENVQSFGDE